jgi:hypothetical protein
MTDSAPASAPRRRPFADPRLLIGLLLVAASIAASDLVARGVALDGSDALYLGVGEVPRGGLVVTRAVAQGELVPASSVGRTSDVDATSLVLRLATRVSAAVKPGASIDVWSATPATTSAKLDGEDADPPAVLVSGATVVRVMDDDQALTADRDGSAVEVRLPRSRVARVLAAIAAGDDLSIVPEGLALRAAS